MNFRRSIRATCSPGIRSEKNSRIELIRPQGTGKARTSSFSALFACLLFLFASFSGQLGAKTIEVCPQCQHKTLKSAVAAAVAGDIVKVKSGYYPEHAIVIDKPISVIGEGNPVVDAQLQGGIITVKKSKGVVIRGLTLKNIKQSYTEDLAAIKFIESPKGRIEDNIIDNACYGIYLSHSDSCVITGNRLKAYSPKESSSGNGIHLWYCKSATIIGNEVSGHRDGIYFEFVENSFIKHNYCHGQIRYGLHFMFSHGCQYLRNVFQNNGAGVAVMYSKRISMIENRFADNWSQISHGVLLKDISDSKIEHNVFKRNTIAIYAEGCNRNTIFQNELRENGWGLKILGNCEDNAINENNFFSNTFEVVTNSSKNSNRFEGNFWSNYNGYDLDRDGFGDVPHSPITLYSYMIEEVPSSIILLRSLFIDLLNLAEKMTPVITPETYKDEKPKMQPNQW